MVLPLTSGSLGLPRRLRRLRCLLVVELGWQTLRLQPILRRYQPWYQPQRQSPAPQAPQAQQVRQVRQVLTAQQALMAQQG